MFIISQKGQPAATLRQEESGDWSLTYLPTTQQDINPAYPVRSEPYKMKSVPRFVGSLLPSSDRRKLMEKGRHITPGDLGHAIRQCLSLENVGDLTLAVEMREAANGVPLTTETPAPNRIVARSLAELESSALRSALVLELRQKAAAAGLGGSWPKAFLNTVEGQFIIKHYPDVDIPGAEVAKLEERSLRAAAIVGMGAARGEAYGNFLVSARFDRGENQAPYSICHMADLGEETDMFAGSYEKLVKAANKIEAGGVKSLVKQVLFSFALGDSDHHSENFALIRRKDDRWTVAPLFDSLPSRFITGDPEHLALTLNGKKSRIQRADLEALGKLGGMSPVEVRSFLTDSLEAIRDEVLPAMPETIRAPFQRHLTMVAQITAGAKYQEVEALQASKSSPSLSEAMVRLSAAKQVRGTAEQSI
jgi:hypothetical protein